MKQFAAILIATALAGSSTAQIEPYYVLEQTVLESATQVEQLLVLRDETRVSSRHVGGEVNIIRISDGAVIGQGSAKGVLGEYYTGELVDVATDSGVVTIRKISDGNLLASFSDTVAFESASMSADGRFASAITTVENYPDPNSVYVWSLMTVVHDTSVVIFRVAQLSGTGEKLLSIVLSEVPRNGNADYDVNIFELPSGTKSSSAFLGNPGSGLLCSPVLGPITVSTNSKFALTPGEFGFRCSSARYDIPVWDLESDTVRYTRGNMTHMSALAISPDGSFAAESGQTDHHLNPEVPHTHIWRVTDHTVIAGYSSRLEAVALTTGGNNLITAKNGISFWRQSTVQPDSVEIYASEEFPQISEGECCYGESVNFFAEVYLPGQSSAVPVIGARWMGERSSGGMYVDQFTGFAKLGRGSTKITATVGNVVSDTLLAEVFDVYYPPTAIADPMGKQSLTLSQNSPNPFNPTTTISFSLPEDGLTHLTVYNLTGQVVRKLVTESMATGNHTSVWDGRNESGQPVASGVYFYTLVHNSRTVTRRMLLIR